MASVATVVVVGVKLLRRPRVERGRRRWVGVIRRCGLSQSRGFLPGVIIILGTCTSTSTNQTPPAENVSAPLFAHPAPTKTKPGSPRANHVQVVLTVLPVHRVAKTIAMLDRISTPTKVPA